MRARESESERERERERETARTHVLCAVSTQRVYAPVAGCSSWVVATPLLPYSAARQQENGAADSILCQRKENIGTHRALLGGLHGELRREG